jgi:membrane-bound metal-dependent hydrolase YbcI (DUF457 family)
MRWRSHAVIGAALSGLVFWFLGVREPVLLASLAAFGALSALVPDLDHESSKGRKILDVCFVAFALLAVYLGGCGLRLCGQETLLPLALAFLALMGAYFILFRFFKPRHRGITHTLLACGAFGLLLYLIAGPALALAGFAGYLSHLIADNHVKLI